MMIQVLQVGPYGTNCYILCDEAAKVCAVVDPGDEPELILSAVEKLDCTVDKILITHGHSDHTDGVPALMEALPPTAVYIHQADYDCPDTQLFPLKSDLSRIPFGGVNFYGEGDRLTVGTREVQVLHTPGHSKGSVTLLCGDVLITGDTLFASSCGRTDFTGGSAKEMMVSLARLAALPGDYQVLPGHMEPTTLERERRVNPYVQTALRERG